MFSLSELKQTRFYQEAFTEGKEEGIEQGARLEKLKTAPLLLRLGLSVEQTAQELGLSVEEVRKAGQ